MEENRYLERVTCRRLTQDGWQEEPACLVRECELLLTVNGVLLPRIVCSPVDLEELILGVLRTGGYLHRKEQLKNLIIDDSGLPERASARAEVTPEPETEPAQTDVFWDAQAVQTLSDYVVRDAQSHRSSHSTHSFTLMLDGKILCCREDIGRHNAIDRAVGWAAAHDVPAERCLSFFSGRVSADAVRRVHRAGIPVLCAKALPTAQAVKLARELGLTLLHCSDRRGILQF